MSLGFVEFFGITIIIHGYEGTERCPVYVGPRFGSFCVIVGKINNMLLCVKKNNVIYIYLLDVLTWNCNKWKLYVRNIII